MRKNSIALFVAALIIYPSIIPPAHARLNSTELYNEAKRIAMSGDIDAAIRAFKKVIEVNPYYALGHYGLGKAYLYKEGNIKDAIRELATAVACDRRFARGYFYLGLAYMFAGKYNQSIHAFSTAYDQDSMMFEALYNLSVIYDLMGITYRANKYYDRYLFEKNKRESEILF